MFKITLYDQNLPAFISGGVSFFVENLRKFEAGWYPSCNESEKELYVRSKSGFFASAAYGVGADSNMVIQDRGAKILEQKKYFFQDFNVDVVNTYGCSHPIFAREAKIVLAKMKFQGEGYFVGQYQLHGGCQKFEWREDGEYLPISTYGNPIFLQKKSEGPVKELPDGSKRRDQPKEFYAYDYLKTYCWIVLAYNKSEEDLPESLWDLDEELKEKLFADIPGEGG